MHAYTFVQAADQDAIQALLLSTLELYFVVGHTLEHGATLYEIHLHLCMTRRIGFESDLQSWHFEGVL